MTAMQTNGGTGKKTLRGGGSIEIERLPHGELYLNRAGGKAGLVSQFVRAGDHYRADYRPETLLAAKGIRVTKLSIPGLGTCVLKEMSTAETPGWRKKLSMWIGIAFRRKYRRTFRVALAARSAGVDAYEHHAYWHDRRNGGRQYFLCEFVDGNSFEDLARRMAYPDEDREAVLAGFRTLGNMAARLNDHGIVNSDMLPQNVILSEDGKGETRPRLIDLDLACFAPKGGRRMAFVHRMRAFRRFVTHYSLNEECLSAFLDAYSRGDREYAVRCRKALEILKKHDRHRVWAGLRLWLLGPPARNNGKTLETTG